MNVKIIFDSEENEYICFIEGVLDISGFGSSEENAILDFLRKCEGNPLFNQKIITHLIQKIS